MQTLVAGMNGSSGIVSGSFVRVTADGLSVHDYSGHDLDWLQSMVGGVIEVASDRFPEDPAIVLICNEEGLLVRSPRFFGAIGGQPFAGDLLIMAEREGEEGLEFCGLSAPQVEIVQRYTRVLCEV
jgi:Domain of unknown function (DUF3846)